MAEAFDLGLADVGDTAEVVFVFENLFGDSAPAAVVFEAGWCWPLGGVEGGLLRQEAGFELLVVEEVVFGSERFGVFAAEHH